MSQSCTSVCSIWSVFLSLLNVFGHVSQAPPDVPQYVLDYAPLVYLYSTDHYRPSDIGAQLQHTRPEVNFTAITGVPDPLTLDNLGSINSKGGTNIYLTSTDNVTQDPSWLAGVTPDANGKTNGATSCAIIVHDHGSGGIVDAFYMYFYAYNRGPFINTLNEGFGNHVGDWEHNAIRFKNGVPQSMWYSQHSNGKAYAFAAVPKSAPPAYLTSTGRKVPYYGPLRPIVYSANGSHANYATTGKQDLTPPGLGLPKFFVSDYADKGVLWDPTLSAYYYSVSFPSNSTSTATSTSAPNPSPTVVTVPGGGGSNPIPTFSAYAPAASASTTSAPTSWLDFVGLWGDEQYLNSDPVQTSLLGFYRYVGGPTGPEDKGLDRSTICLGVTNCIIHNSV